MGVCQPLNVPLLGTRWGAVNCTDHSGNRQGPVITMALERPAARLRLPAERRLATQQSYHPPPLRLIPIGELPYHCNITLYYIEQAKDRGYAGFREPHPSRQFGE